MNADARAEELRAKAAERSRRQGHRRRGDLTRDWRACPRCSSWGPPGDCNVCEHRRQLDADRA